MLITKRKVVDLVRDLSGADAALRAASSFQIGSTLGIRCSAASSKSWA